MTAIAPTTTDIGNGAAYIVQWASVSENDTCNAVSYPLHSDKSIQVTGTFAGTSVALQGSNDGSNFEALNDPTGNVIGITAAGIKAVLEDTRYIKPVLTGGTGVSVTITMLVHLTMALRT